LKAGDVVTEVDDTPIYDADGLVLNVGKLPANAVARLGVLREGKPRVLAVTLTKYAVRGEKVVTSANPTWRGMRVDYPSAVVREESSIRTEESPVEDAVMVVEVAENSPAFAAGVRRGMLIMRVDDVLVRSPAEFAMAVEKRTEVVRLQVSGQQNARLLIVKPTR
jgi:S1-C subfamily serine protease